MMSESGSTPEELQRDFVMPSTSPVIGNADTTKIYDFFFDYQSTRMGRMELQVDHNAKGILWRQCFPFLEHASEEQIRKIFPQRFFDTTRIPIDWIRGHEGNYTDPATTGMQGKGLGTLSHVLIVDWLAANLPQSDTYTIRYSGTENMRPRLLAMLERLELLDLADNALPLREVQQTLRKNAAKLFGFRFGEESSPVL